MGNPRIGAAFSANESIALNDLSDVTITAVANGDLIQYNASLAQWVNVPVSSLTISPGGSNTQVQFNDNGVFGGNVNFTFNKATGIITIAHYTTSGGFLYTDGSGVINQSGAGTSTTLLHGGTTPTYSAVSLTADITGVLAETHGGTNQSTYALGDTLYASAANTLSKLAGNITTTKKFLTQTGNGAVSAAPSWGTIVAGDLPTGNLTEATSSVLTIGSGTGAVIGSGTTIQVTQSDATHNGYLSSTDWGTFNSKVSTSRAINTTSPLTGGGNLSADRTLGIGSLTTLGTGNYVVGVNAGATAWEYKNLLGTTSQIVVTHGVGTITLSTPQNIDTAASVTFGNITDSAMTAKSILFAGTSGIIAQDNSNFVYDSTNIRFGLGVGASPSNFVQMTGIQPASVASTPGTGAGTTFALVGASGGNTTIATTGTGGSGGSFTYNGGVGGTAASAVTNATGGPGGTISLTSGAGGASQTAGSGTNTGGNGGTVTVAGGSGGVANTGTGVNVAGNGGLMKIQGGTGANASNGSSNTGGSGGDLRLLGGVAGTGSTANGTAGSVTFFIAGSEVARFNGANNDFGVGVTSPTALVHIKAGTATANTAPLQFNSGTIETSARAGVMEYNGNLYFTQGGVVRYSMGGTIFDHYADAGNTTTGETDLYSDTTAANTFNTNGDKICARYSGIFVSNATATREIRAYFAGTSIYDTGALTTSTAEAWDMTLTIIRDTTTSVRCVVTLIASTSLGAKLFADTIYTAISGLTLSGTNILKITGQAGGVGAATNDIVAKLGFVEFKGAI